MFKRLRSYWKIKRAADKLLDYIEEEQKVSKSIFRSKTFWFNLLALLNELIKILPGMSPNQIPTVSTETLLPLIAAGNIILRRLTSESVKIFTNGKDDF